MGNFKVHIRYVWGMFNLYINMRRFVLESFLICAVIAIMALAFRDYFILIAVPMWLVFTVIALYAKWKTTIKRDRDKFMRQFELEEKYSFLYERFIKDE